MTLTGAPGGQADGVGPSKALGLPGTSGLQSMGNLAADLPNFGFWAHPGPTRYVRQWVCV